jgi:sugar phosphate isomerase/epimerase
MKSRNSMNSVCLLVGVILLLTLIACQAFADDPKWINVSSKSGGLPVPGESTQQTGSLVADLDKDGITDFVLSFRKVAPALVWYRRQGNRWTRILIEREYLTVEAGGAAHDIDGDGDLDIVFGGDSQSNQVWWWENPAPNFDPNVSWQRRLIKNSGAKQHHDQAFGDFKGTGKPQLAFWNQQAKTIFLADIPKDPRNTDPWPMIEMFSGSAGEVGDKSGAFKYAEGTTAADVDGDGKVDLLAGNFWFKHLGGDQFKAVKVGTIGGRIAAGKFKPGKTLQIVIAPGDGSGPLKFYECKGNPENEADWVGTDLLGRDLIHGHTLDLGDLDGDGKLDIFAAEMAKWTANTEPDNPKATAFILYGDGKGGFRKTELIVGHGFHEGRVADLDGDGDLDILNKPYTWEAPRVDVWLNNGTGKLKSKTPANKKITAVGTGASFKGPLGLQLYSLRFEFKKDVLRTLDEVRRFGFREVELAGAYGYAPADFRRELNARGLTPVSAMVDFNLLKNDLDKVIAEAKALGVQYVGCGWIPHKRPFNMDNVNEAAAVFNAAGEKLKAAGLKFFYHPHGYEFQPTANGTLMDELAAKCKPEFVYFELDVFWATHAGQDPVKLLEKYPKRFVLMHVKDLRKDVAGDLTGSAKDDTSVVIGAGKVNWAAVLKAAKKAGIKHYFIEDEAETAPQQIPQSLRYLEGLHAQGQRLRDRCLRQMASRHEARLPSVAQRL